MSGTGLSVVRGAAAGPPSPAWQLSYAGANITADASQAALEITYDDKAEHAASTIEVKLEDRERLWQGAWFPTRGDVLELAIGYAGALTPCGLFQVDEVALEGPPDVVSLTAISAYITPDMRTHFSRAYEGQSLLQIAGTIAASHGLTVVGAPATPDVTLRRLTQKHETDLQFLRRLAHLYGYNFSIRGQQLVFDARTHLEAAATIAALVRGRDEIEKFHFKTATQLVYRRATVSYLDPATKAVVTQSIDADPPVPTGDELRIPERAESGPDALAKASAALHANNMHQVTGSLTVVGDARLMAGLTVDVAGFGKFDGKYFIEGAKHSLRRTAGYSTDLEVRLVP